MKRFIIIAVVALQSLGLLYSESAYRICTFNIRSDKASDGINVWKNRKASVANVIRAYEFDIVGFQEANDYQYEDLKLMREFTHVGELGRPNGSYRNVGFKHDRFELLDENTFGINETGEPGKVGWDAKYERACTWVKVREKQSGEVFCVFNVHLDHKGLIAQTEGAKFVCEKVKEIANGLPLVVMGDMNTVPDSETYKIFTTHFTDAINVTEKAPLGPSFTYHGWGTTERRIDFVFVEGMTVNRYETVDIEYHNNRYVSDHYPVYVDVTLGDF